MAMSAFQLEGVDQTALVPDTNFPQLVKGARANPSRFSEQIRANPLINLMGPAGMANETVLKHLVAEIEAGAVLPAEEFARRAMAWLQSHHSYALSVKMPAREGQDDIVRWLDSSEPGYCEYFAAGLTVLARTAGYPARMITGFHGGVLNAFENYYMVRNSDAHAWAEIYDGKAAWVRFDPTPGTAATAEAIAAQAARQEHDSSWSARFDSLRVIWYRRIVNFDSRAQVQMLEQVKSFTLDSSSAVRVKFEELSKKLKLWFNQPWNSARLGREAGLAAGGVACIWFLMRLVRWSWLRWRGWRRPQEFDPVRREAGKQLARLRGLSGQRQNSGDPMQPLEEVVGDLRRLRYGHRETWPEPRGVFKRARRMRRAARG
jgi:hypothetical protein